MRVLAELLQPVEGETPYGGRTRSYEPLGMVWLKTFTTRRREKSDGGATRIVDAMTVETRTDPRLVEGRVLRFGGGDWAVTGQQGVGGRPGRVELTLERGR
ncbi:phage head-tail adapter protein [Brevundimonas goettingensis]|uniref:Phage head-tail adapter protein n=1 Tax=Brevundimonas goettingensis TaxID=2774190 RepID=A0A975GXQ0_9CAUL|nr:phage head-tail adapter protein [Brevundimonas goettingensis]